MSVIKKSEVGRLSAEDLRIVEKVESYINLILNRKFRKGSSLGINFRDIEHDLSIKLSDLIVDKIIADYQDPAAGWKVKVENDMREGSYFVFS